jgi:NADH dehydrogenase FAD-containing subunit
LTLDVKITILEQARTVLTAFDTNLQEYAQKMFHRQHIKIKTGVAVKAVEKDCVVLDDGSRIECGFTLWSAGIQARELLRFEERSAGLNKDKRSRLIVDNNLVSVSDPKIYAMGDCSVIEGKELAQTAQVAQQEGKYLTKKLNYEGQHYKQYPEQFVYHHRGKMAYLGSYRAVFDADNAKIKGYLSWFFWRSVYLTTTVSVKNKLLIPIDWTKTFIFGRDITKF